MKSGPTTLAAVNMHVEHDPKKNFAEYEKYIQEAAKQKASLIAFPEVSLQGFIWTWDEDTKTFADDPEQREYFDRTAETVPGPTTSKLSILAKQYNMYIQFGLIEKDGANKYNTAALIGPEGFVGAHRKVHGAKNPVYGYGSSYDVHNTSLGRIGSIICMDLVFSETARVLALKGAEMIVNSSAWSIKEAPDEDYRGKRYELLCKANAAFNQVWFVSSNEVGRGGRTTDNCYGHSLIVDPRGEVIADGGYKEGLVTAEVDLQKGMQESVKLFGRFLKARRSDTYKPVLEINVPSY